MSDERLRALERNAARNAADTGALEQLMTEQERIGDTATAAQTGRRILELNINNENARELVARYAPLSWTGTIELPQDKGCWRFTAREGRHQYELDLSRDKPHPGIIRDIAYAADTFTILTRAPPERAADLFEFTLNCRKYTSIPGTIINLVSDNQRRLVLTEEPRSESVLLQINPDDSEIARLFAGLDEPHEISYWHRGIIPTMAGSSQHSPWICEDQSMDFFSPQTTLFRPLRQVTASTPAIAYGNTVVPATSRLARKINQAASESDLASVYDGFTRVLIEIPIKMLNALRKYAGGR
ncbi:hypothetical protein J4219_07900 [Candidatus Woesearchaeota archaeon]|nr:hypothetical protein [Candidatus Woesearchaeota archaeon]